MVPAQSVQTRSGILYRPKAELEHLVGVDLNRPRGAVIGFGGAGIAAKPSPCMRLVLSAREEAALAHSRWTGSSVGAWEPGTRCL